MLECTQSNKISDGFCNDETNNVECDFDGGDCCGTCVLTQQCSECLCLGNSSRNMESSTSFFMKNQNVLLGNGYCNPETNNALCYFDGLDCCHTLSPDDQIFSPKCHGKI